MPRKLGPIERFVPRQEAGLDGPNCTSPLPISAVSRIFVHYTAAEVDRQDVHANCAARWRAIQDFHQKTRGWCDVAYSVGVCRHGYAFEGRWIGEKTAATGPCNSNSYAIVFMGADKIGRDDVGSAGRETIAEVHAYFETLKKARLARKGHRDCMSTSCPGDELYKWIRSAAFRKLVDAQKAARPLVEVWQLRSGNRTLKSYRAGTKVAGENALERLLAWAHDHDGAVKNAERENGFVAIRKIKVPG